MSRYPLVLLGDILELAIDEVVVDPDETYPIAGVYSFGRGVISRTPIVGSETKYAKLHRLHVGQLVMSRLNGWEGALAVVGTHHDGHFVSQEFPTFDVRGNVAHTRFVGLLARWPSLWDGLLQNARGLGAQTGARRLRISADRLLATKVPLPPLDEQARIVERMEGLSSRIDKIVLRVHVSDKLVLDAWEATLRVTFEQLSRDHPIVPLDDVVFLNPESVSPEAAFGPTEFLYVDISAITNRTGRIDAPKSIVGTTAPSRARRRIRSGDVLLSTVRPNLRGIAQVPPTLDAHVASTGFAVLRPSSSLLPDFLLYQALSDVVISQLVGEVRGGHYPAVNDASLRRVRLCVPPLGIQQRTAKWLKALHVQINLVVPMMEARTKALGAVIPAALDEALLDRSPTTSPPSRR